MFSKDQDTDALLAAGLYQQELIWYNVPVLHVYKYIYVCVWLWRLTYELTALLKPSKQICVGSVLHC